MLLYQLTNIFHLNLVFDLRQLVSYEFYLLLKQLKLYYLITDSSYKLSIFLRIILFSILFIAEFYLNNSNFYEAYYKFVKHLFLFRSVF